MKYVLVIGSGMADRPIPQLANHTPMEVLALNSFDRVAGCFLGRALTVPHGTPVDSAILTILGYDPRTYAAGDDLPAFPKQGSMIASSPLVNTIARLAGLKTPAFSGEYEAKAEAALAALDGGDEFVAVHIAAPDKFSREGDLAGKLEAVQSIEYRVVMRLLNQLMGREEAFRLMLIPDHQTCLTTQTPGRFPVPYGIFDSRTVRAALAEGKEPPIRKFSEAESEYEPVLMDGTELMKVLFER